MSSMSGYAGLIIRCGPGCIDLSARLSAGARAALVLLAILGTPGTAQAFDKASCVDSHASAQRWLKAGHLRDSKDQLLVCADSSCPPLVREDCEKWLSTFARNVQPVTIDAPDVANATAPCEGTTCATSDRKARDRSSAAAAERRSEAPQRADSLAPGGAPTPQTSSAAPLGAQGGHDEPPPGDGVVRMPPVQRRHSRPITAWVTGVFALASFGTAAVFGVTGMLKAQSLKDTCAPNCSSSAVSAARQDLLIADVSALTGVAFSAVTAWIIWTRKDGDAPEELKPEAAKLSAWITGRSFRLDYTATF